MTKGVRERGIRGTGKEGGRVDRRNERMEDRKRGGSSRKGGKREGRRESQ